MLYEDAKQYEEKLKLSLKAKTMIDSLSKEELIQEINNKNRSQFQGDKYSYLQTRLATLEEEETSQHRNEDLAHKAEELTLAREANKLSKAAIIVSIFAALLALAALSLDFIIGA